MTRRSPTTGGPGAARDDPRSAMLLMVVATLVLPGIDALAKWLAATVPPGQIAWARFAFQSLLMLPLVLALPGRVRPRDLPLHAARGVLLSITTLLFFWALTYLPIADAIAIFFVEPLILTLLSIPVLGERVGWRRLSAVVLGLLGALIVIRPGFAAVGWAACLPLGAACCFAVYLLVTRTLAQREDPARMQFFSGLFGLAAMSVAVLAGWASEIAIFDPVWPSAVEWGLMAGLGIIATFGHLLVVHAFRRAEAALLAPFQYLEIVSATVLGFVVFGDFPDGLTWLGVGIIVGSGLYVFQREQRQAGTCASA